MFKKLPTEEAAARSAEVAAWFNDHKTQRSHRRPLRYADIHGRGVEVHLLEDDDDLQDAVLSVWHGVQLTLTGTAVNKIVETVTAKPG
jgi:uncharacterized protein YpuA (DUF1002 family)